MLTRREEVGLPCSMRCGERTRDSGGSICPEDDGAAVEERREGWVEAGGFMWCNGCGTEREEMVV